MIEEASKLQNIETKWEDVLIDMKPVIEEILSMQTIEVESTEEEVKGLINNFEQYIDDKEYRKLVLYIRKGEEMSGNYEKT